VEKELLHLLRRKFSRDLHTGKVIMSNIVVKYCKYKYTSYVVGIYKYLMYIL